MARYTIDAPTLLRLVADDIRPAAAHQLVAPAIIRSQALALLLAAVRAGEMSESEAMTQHERLTELKMRVLGDRVSRRTAWKLALEHGWDLHDAEYVAVCKLQADAFVTVDKAMAAKAELVVAIATLADLTSTK